MDSYIQGTWHHTGCCRSCIPRPDIKSPIGKTPAVQFIDAWIYSFHMPLFFSLRPFPFFDRRQGLLSASSAWTKFGLLPTLISFGPFLPSCSRPPSESFPIHPDLF